MFNRVNLLVLSSVFVAACEPVPRAHWGAEAEGEPSTCSGVTVHEDADGDGFGDAATARDGCVEPGWVEDNGDCDDADGAVHPGASEVACNSVDDDCSGGSAEHYLAGRDLQSELDAVPAGELACIPAGDYERLQIDGQVVAPVAGVESVTFTGRRGVDTVVMNCGSLSGVTIVGGEVGLRASGACAVMVSDLDISRAEQAVVLESTVQADVSGVYVHDVGAGILLDGVALVRLERVQFERSSSASGGAAMRIVGAEHVDCEELIFENNEAGAMWIEASSHVSVVDSLFRQNVAELGGGIYAIQSTGLSVLDTVFEGNTAAGGGAVYLEDVADAYFEGVEVNENEAQWGGGFLAFDGSLRITSSAIAANRAVNAGLSGIGGGALVMYGTLEGDENEWSENEAADYGGALAFIDGEAVVRDWIEDNNAGTHGGGIYTSSGAAVDAVGAVFDGNKPEDIY